MVELLYLKDSYLKECDTTVISVSDGRYIVLDKTIFYSKGGGQPYDTGRIVKTNDEFNVAYVSKFSGLVSHEVDRKGLKKGDEVHCVLDWKRRYRLMRSHTSAHCFSSLLCNGTGALVTGNQLDVDKVRFDFSLKDFDRSILERYIDKANKLFLKDIPVKWYELPREEALKIPGVIKMAAAFPPNLPSLRIVEIVGVDKQADGGTHVRNLKEVGQIKLIKCENKGKNNRRVYYSLVP